MNVTRGTIAIALWIKHIRQPNKYTGKYKDKDNTFYIHSSKPRMPGSSRVILPIP
jgi:hypothetical protein